MWMASYHQIQYQMIKQNIYSGNTVQLGTMERCGEIIKKKAKLASLISFCFKNQPQFTLDRNVVSCCIDFCELVSGTKLEEVSKTGDAYTNVKGANMCLGKSLPRTFFILAA